MIGIVVASSVSVIVVAVYYSNQVSYEPTDTTWNVNNVKDALDELYSLIITDFSVYKTGYMYIQSNGNWDVCSLTNVTFIYK